MRNGQTDEKTDYAVFGALKRRAGKFSGVGNVKYFVSGNIKVLWPYPAPLSGTNQRHIPNI